MSSLKTIIKKSPLYRPLMFAREVKLFPGTIGFMSRYRALPEGSVLLVGTPLHRNLGDHLIAEAEMQFLKDCFPEKEIMEIPTKTFVRYADDIRRFMPKDLSVFITGGGWMGSLWPEDELILQQMADTFSDCRLTIMPQTIFYERGSEEGEELLRTANAVFRKCRDLLICARDRASYEFASENFEVEKSRIVLVPDIALYYKTDLPDGDGFGRAGLCLRSDREQVSSEALQEVVSYLSERFELVTLDTICPKPVGMTERAKRIKQIISDMRNCELILTDRLHAMIFSVIAGRKCIAADNRTRKVSGVAGEWLNWNSDILLLPGNEEIDRKKLTEFINNTKCDKDYRSELAPIFDTLKRKIKREGE